ncbi:MAG: LysE family transporter [Rhodobacteraceae bacterium]|nr:LysE family transporter [Paracoccaceae bacterium]MBR9821240.1 LysE family transporter [Paracoccaceae bacterium]
MEALFLKGAGLGLAVAAPLGPIGALCIARTLERGFAAGLSGGLGTALADAAYAAMAALGFAVFAGVLAVIDLPLRLAGGAFMLWLGLRGLRRTPPRAEAGIAIGARDLLGTVAATFLLTLANPSTILSFAALFAGLGLASDAGPGAAGVVTAGVFCGSMLWWTLLSGAVAASRHRLPQGFTTWVARLSALILTGFGLWAIGSALRLLAT